MMPGSDLEDYPATQVIATRKELMRALAENILAVDASGMIVDPLHLEWAQKVMITTSKQWGHMGAGEPALAEGQKNDGN